VPIETPVRRRGFIDALVGTLAGRAIVVGVAVRLVDFLIGAALGRVPAFLNVVDTVAAAAIAAAGVFFLVRGVSLMNRRLLWRVRRKLIISYIFIGFIPAILLLAFFALGVVLLFINFSGYLVRSNFHELSTRADAIARTVAAEIERAGGRDVHGILERRQASAEREFPGASMAVVRLDRPCATRSSEAEAASGHPASLAITGPWSHVEPPDAIPGWIDCDGFRGLLVASSDDQTIGAQPAVGGVTGDRIPIVVAPRDARVVVRAVAFPPSAHPGYGVVVDLVFNSALKQQLRDAIGVELERVSEVSRNVGLLHSRAGGGSDPAQEDEGVSPPLTTFAQLEYRDWKTGQAGTLQASIRLGIGEIYDRISSAPGLDNTRNVVIILLEFVGGLFLVIEIIALTTGLALARSITGSVHELFAGTERVRQGDFIHKIAVKAKDQLGELAESFNLMTASIEDLLRQTKEKKRLEEELRIAHEIQMSLLPQGPLHMPGLSVTALCVPAREVGGDYYDFLRLDNDRLGLLIADVSGKGTSAALYMAELKGLMLSLSRIHASPRALLIEANSLIAEHLDARSFITMTYAVIDLKAGTMTYARAGHTPLIYLPGAGSAARVARILAPDGLVLGLKIDGGEMFERLLEEDTLHLRPGDLYVFFTDGITEAMNARDDFFGDARLGGLVEEHADLPPEELRERVLREINAFVGDAPQHDDMTMILLKIDDRHSPRSMS
jgi:sigma-B regulation protein RsbU (phosphoserine phosphatase)